MKSYSITFRRPSNDEVLSFIIFMFVVLCEFFVISDVIRNDVNNPFFWFGWIIIIINCILVCAEIFSFFMLSHKKARHVFQSVLIFSTLTICFDIFIIADKVINITGYQIQYSSYNSLVLEAIIAWWSNILLFTVWYWFIDRNGEENRLNNTRTSPDFWFTAQSIDIQSMSENIVPTAPQSSILWKPKPFDYLFLAFTTSTAFSPTDTQVVSRRGKLLIMVQSMISLIILVTLFARAINMIEVQHHN